MNKKITEDINAIKFIRLSMGDDIIAEIEGDDKSCLYIKNICRVVTEMDMEAGQQTILVFPWLPKGISKTPMASMTIKKTNIVVMTDVDDSIREHYANICDYALDKIKRSRKPVIDTANAIPTNVIAFGDKKDRFH